MPLDTVDGRVHTNGLENFWSLLKRGISGTYVSVEPFHLFRYLDEQSFRYNNRKDMTDADRFSLASFADRGKAAHLQGSDRQGGRNEFLTLCAGSAGRSRNAGSSPRPLLLFLRCQPFLDSHSRNGYDTAEHIGECREVALHVFGFDSGAICHGCPSGKRGYTRGVLRSMRLPQR